MGIGYKMIIPISDTPHGSILCTLHGLSSKAYHPSDFDDIVTFNNNINKLSIYNIYNAVRVEYKEMSSSHENMHSHERQRYKRIVVSFMHYMIEKYSIDYPEIRI